MGTYNAMVWCVCGIHETHGEWSGVRCCVVRTARPHGKTARQDTSWEKGQDMTWFCVEQCIESSFASNCA